MSRSVIGVQTRSLSRAGKEFPKEKVMLPGSDGSSCEGEVPNPWIEIMILNMTQRQQGRNREEKFVSL